MNQVRSIEQFIGYISTTMLCQLVSRRFLRGQDEDRNAKFTPWVTRPEAFERCSKKFGDTRGSSTSVASKAHNEISWSPGLFPGLFAYEIKRDIPLPFLEETERRPSRGVISRLRVVNLHEAHIERISKAMCLGQCVVVKQLPKESNDFEKRQAEVLKAVSERPHPYVIKTITRFLKGRESYIVLPCIRSGRRFL
ncbi:hypothetical protein F5Y16DRAFT_391727 [Xylariaceae sp. FL0255]|nr:hypothetical protein F5Y16DRAFT_391727 [Xylariaceae sp. FL0255]